VPEWPEIAQLMRCAGGSHQWARKAESSTRESSQDAESFERGGAKLRAALSEILDGRLLSRSARRLLFDALRERGLRGSTCGKAAPASSEPAKRLPLHPRRVKEVLGPHGYWEFHLREAFRRNRHMVPSISQVPDLMKTSSVEGGGEPGTVCDQWAREY